VSARAEIKDRIADKEFGAKLLRKDEAATKEWDALHKAGYPAPQQITSADDVQAQAAARNEKEWSTFIAALGTQWQITPEQISELRNGVVREDIRNIALQRRDAMVKDKAWYRRLLDGDRQAKEEWSKVVADIGLRPVKVQS
jgi:5-formaminoimidazole-4-carboxamide-1-beta-D-ribofuranosyl 5'-monophosphate synthetase